MNKKIIFLSFLFFLISCGGIEFVLKDRVEQFKHQTTIVVEGDKTDTFYRELLIFFGNQKNGEFILVANYSENKENRLVKKNQVAEKINYEVVVSYNLYYQNRNCNIYNKKITTKFSFVPKSFGYNFGTDRSLDRLYKDSIRENILGFINLLPDQKNCVK